MTINLKDLANHAAELAEVWRSDPRIADIYEKIAVLADALADVMKAPPAPPPSSKKKGKKR